MPHSCATQPGESLSPSQASTFLDCQARWAFKYFYGLPDPPSGAAVRGTAVHAVVAHAMRMRIAGLIAEPQELAECYVDAFDQASEGAEFQKDEDLAQLRQSGAVLAARYLEEAAIEPAAVEKPVSGEIAGVKVRGIIDLVDASGRIIDLKVAKRTPGGLAANHAFQLATYAALLPESSGAARIDMLVATKEPKLVSIDHTPGAGGKRMVESLYPRVAEGIAGGLYLPNRNSNLCSRKYCPYADQCQKEFGGTIE